MKFKTLLFVFFGIVLVLGIYFVLTRQDMSTKLDSPATTASSAAKPNDNKSYLTDNKSAPKLESVLYDLFRAQGKLSFAKTRNLEVVDGRVLVVLELNDEQYKLPIEFGIEATRAGKLLQAQVEIDKLLELTDDPGVRLIRTPQKPVPLQ